MVIELKRTYNCPTYCIGHLYVDGVYLCDTIEDIDRGLDDKLTVEKNNKLKVRGATAIPTGTYTVTLNVISPKYSKKEYYKKFCGGRVPRLLNVKAFTGILIHTGVNQNSTEGCIIVGYNKIKGAVINSQQAFEKLYNLMKKASSNIQIKITRKYNVIVK